MSRYRDSDDRRSATDETGPRCLGKSWAFLAYQYRGVEHGAGKLHPPCPHCGAGLGCARCAGPWAETICTKCVAWASLDGFVEHGAFLNTEVMIARRGGKRARTFGQYPVLWQHRYRQAHADDPTPDPADLDEMQRRLAL